MKQLLFTVLFFFSLNLIWSQQNYFGVDLSYVNEMEACGEIFTENNVPKDPYEIFADHGSNLVRLRLWHTPSWYDGLNAGKRYSDYADVRKSMQRAKAAGMDVLLDFHLSDIWADPGHQVVPAAWNSVVGNVNILKDSLYNYVHKTLSDLAADGLLPAMVQIGNETNRGILLSQAVNDAGWSLDWGRNTILFNAAIRAVRDIETASNQPIQVAIHIADPIHADWYAGNFISNGVTDFDIIGISYYHQWHGTSSLSQVGNIISGLIQDHGKDVIILETGYPWTTAWEDNANNIISTAHPSYAPLSPVQQEKWLTDLTSSVINNGGKGVVYWEPAWVSSACSTQWAQGSHYENATFFDFQNNLHPNGGIKWLEKATTSITSLEEDWGFQAVWEESGRIRITRSAAFLQENVTCRLYDMNGRIVLEGEILPGQIQSRWRVSPITQGIYSLQFICKGKYVGSLKTPFLY